MNTIIPMLSQFSAIISIFTLIVAINGKEKINKIYTEEQQSCRKFGSDDVYPSELNVKSHSLHYSKVQSKFISMSI